MAAKETVLNPREAAQFIASKATDVKIKEDKLEQLSNLVWESFAGSEFKLSDWKSNDVNPTVADERAVDWIFFVDSLNFSFWGPDIDNQFKAQYKNQSYTGYFSLCALTQKAIQNGRYITNPIVYANLSRDEFDKLFQSENGVKMPLTDERLHILHDHGTVLLQKFGGTFVNCLKQCQGSAQQLIKIVVENFSSFADDAIFEGTKVALYKRAQILVADIWACFEGKGLGEFHDIDSITMFADYRVPQVLAYFGVLEYSENLTNRLNQGDMFENKERQEVEIRGCSIWAVELIKERLRTRVKETGESITTPINSITIDFFLWGYRRSQSALIDKVPFHRVRCIYY